MKSLKKLTAAVASAVIATTVAVIPTAPLAGADPLAPPITWEACPEQVTVPDAECGRIDVPREYADPAGPTISVGFVRIAADNPSARRGTLFGNPGGPGGDAYTYFGNDEVFQWPAGVTDEWDRVAVQPRGLPGSTPLNCLEPDPNYGNFPLIDQGGFIKSTCDHQNPGLARSLTTSNTVEDWEMVRRALDLEQISIMGLSYGTILGGVYATRYPQRVDRLVLDSAADPGGLWNGLVASQQRAQENALYDFMGFAAERNDVYGLGTTPLQVYNSWSNVILRETGTNPTTVPPAAQLGDVPPGLEWAGPTIADVMTATGQVRVEADGVVTRTLNPGANQTTSPTMALTLASLARPEMWDGLARHINGSEPSTLIDEQISAYEALTEEERTQLDFEQSASLGTLTMVTCNENTVAPDYRWLPFYLWGTFVSHDARAPYTAGYATGAACAGITPVRGPEHYDGSQLDVRPLQISGTGDPQTPYAHHRGLADPMGAHVVTVHGPGHGHVGLGNQAVDDIVVEYLRTGATTATDAPGLI